jgi:hypothetical protein
MNATPENHLNSNYGKPFFLILLFSVVLFGTFLIGFLAYRYLQFNYGSAIHEIAAIFGALAVCVFRGKSALGLFNSNEYWSLIFICLLVEVLITLGLLILIKSLGLGMYLQTLFFRVPMHALMFMFLFSDKRLAKFLKQSTGRAEMEAKQ